MGYFSSDKSIQLPFVRESRFALLLNSDPVNLFLMFLERIRPGEKPLYRPPDFSMLDIRRDPMLLSRRPYSLHLQVGATVPTPFLWLHREMRYQNPL